MGGQQNVIEINGKKYDAATGQLISAPRSAKPAMTKTSKPSVGVGSIDGFGPAPKKATVHHAPRHAASHAKKSTPQKSQTLMRSAVKKPVTPVKKAHEPIEHKSQLGSQHSRHTAALSVPKSPQVHRYEHHSASTVVKKVQPLAVKKHTSTVIAPTAVHHAQQKPHMSAAAKMIERSLANATAHEHPHHELPKKRSKMAKKFGVSSRALAISSTVLAGVLLGGFFAVQNVPNLSMRVAATRAGFDAKMPGYNPSGFSFNGPINYTAGKVTVSFKSNTDDRNYDVTQTASNWNSDALLSNYILQEEKQYQTYVDKGRTLYIYDQSNATWVDNGVWYQVEGESAMTTDQLIKIASSM